MDTVFVVDTLVDTLIQHTTDTLLVTERTGGSMHWSQWLMICASLLVAAGTAALAIATFKMLRKTDEWNKRIDRWNKRNEWARTQPFLSIEKVDVRVSSNGWVKDFFITVKNIGLGPTIAYRIIAQQGKRIFSVVGGYPQQDDFSTYRPLEAGGQPFKTHLRNIAAPPKEAPPEVAIHVGFRDIYTRICVIIYVLKPVEDSQGNWLKRLSDPVIVGLNIDGEVRNISADDSTLPSKYESELKEITGKLLWM